MHKKAKERNGNRLLGMRRGEEVERKIDWVYLWETRLKSMARLEI